MRKTKSLLPITHNYPHFREMGELVKFVLKLYTINRSRIFDIPPRVSSFPGAESFLDAFHALDNAVHHAPVVDYLIQLVLYEWSSHFYYAVRYMK